MCNRFSCAVMRRVYSLCLTWWWGWHWLPPQTSLYSILYCLETPGFLFERKRWCLVSQKSGPPGFVSSSSSLWSFGIAFIRFRPVILNQGCLGWIPFLLMSSSFRFTRLAMVVGRLDRSLSGMLSFFKAWQLKSCCGSTKRDDKGIMTLTGCRKSPEGMRHLMFFKKLGHFSSTCLLIMQM